LSTVVELDPYDVPGQDEAREQAGAKARQARETEESDVQWLMSSKRGRRIVWRLLEQAGVFRSSFSEKPTIMAYQEGCRHFGTHILSLVHNYCPELYPAMLKEHTDGKRSRTE